MISPPRLCRPSERRIEVAIFGGSFNPPQRGHAEAMRYLHNLEHGGVRQFDEVWMLPTYRHAFGKKLIDFALRYKLCELMLEDLGEEARNTRILDVERWLPGESRMVDTLRVLRREHPSCHFTLALGADLEAEFERWKEPDAIRQMAELFFFPRAGYGAPTGVIDATPFAPEVASTQVREALERGESAEALLTPRVWRFIDQYRLYRPNPPNVEPYEDVSSLELVLRDKPLLHRFFGLHRWGLRSHYADGRISDVYFCEAVLRSNLDAVGVILYSMENPADPTVYIRRNLRPAMAFREQQELEGQTPPFFLPLKTHPVVLGMVAGVLEKEDHGEAGLRHRALEEIREEAGFDVEDRDLESLGAPLTGSVGMSPELYHPFAVRIDPLKRKAQLGDGSVMEEVGGLVAMPLSRAFEACVKGEITSAFLEVCLRRLAILLKVSDGQRH